jgi:energy-coupling factor transporter ATP-binding protein EcfA2
MKKSLTLQDRKEILTALADFALKGDAAAEQSDDDFWRRYFVVPRHLKAFDRSVVLVLGERGAGKSQLFQALVKHNAKGRLGKHLGSVRLPDGEVENIVGYVGEGRSFPDHSNLKQALLLDGATRDEHAMNLWAAYLVRSLDRSCFTPDEVKLLVEVFRPQGIDGLAVLKAGRKLGGKLTAVLDALDARLENADRTLVIAYDELDRIGGFDYTLMRDALRGLIGFWAHYTKRWSRIKGKIFVRTDLFRQYSSFLGPDLAKLAANRVEIIWQDDELRLMLIQRMLTTDDYFVQIAKELGCPLTQDGKNFSPNQAHRAEAWRPFIESLLGEYMGANHRKGYTWNWILDHVRDGKRLVAPRALLLLLEQAATIQAESSAIISANHQILTHLSIRAALDRVSAEEVNKAKEFPWLEGLKERIQGLQVPVERQELLAKIRPRWKERWSQQSDVPAPPADTADQFIDVLIDWGVFSLRANGHIDVPDLYRTGLGLKRKGGVRIA